MFNFGGAPFSIHEDAVNPTGNQGNQALKKPKTMDEGKTTQGTKRTALGTITNNTRVQPLRAAKPKTEFKYFNSGKPSFVVHKDAAPPAPVAKAVPPPASQVPAFKFSASTAPPVPMEDSENRAPMSASVVPNRLPLMTLSPEKNEATESPMVLDTSVAVDEDLTLRDDKIFFAQEYASEIHSYLREAETRNRPRLGYMRKQPDITASMRSILVDWLVEVSEEYKLHRETLYLAVNYIDRFLSQMSVLRGKLQLVGAASLYLASKYEEIYPPDVGEFVYITDDTYKPKQVLRMEHLILKVLSFDIAIPTINLFCEKYAKETKCTDATMSLAMYLCELTLVEGETFHKYVASVIASSALCMARHTLGIEPWPQSLNTATGYTISDLSECLNELHPMYLMAPKHPQQAIREKYKEIKFQEVATLPPPLDLPAGTLPLVSDMPQ